MLLFSILLTLMLCFGEAHAQVTASCKDITVQLDSNGLANISASDIDDGSNSIYGLSSITIDKDTFTCSDIGDNTVTLSVIDNFFFGDQCTATVRVVEAISSFSCAGSASFQVSSCSGYTIPDNSLDPSITQGSCSPPVSFTNNFTGTNSLNGATFPVGTTTVVWTADLGNGNTTSCQQDITVTNSSIPVITLVGSTNITVEACTSYNELGATALSPCGLDISSQVAIDNSEVDMSVVGTYTVYYDVTYNGQSAIQATRSVNVTDSINPILSCQNPPAPYNLNSGECDYTITGTSLDPINVSDNCGISSITNSFTNTSTLDGAIFPVGTTTVIWTVTDINNRASSCQYDVVVNGGSGVSVQNCPNDVNAIAGSGLCYYSYNPAEPVFIGICPSMTINWEMTGATSASGTNLINTYNFNVGETIITYTAGNVSCNFSIIVEDTQAPTISNFPADIIEYTSSDGLGDCSTTVNWSEPSVTDNCSSNLILTSSHNSGDQFSTGTTTVTYQTQDDSGNVVSSSFTITIIDDEAPTGLPLSDVVSTCELTFSTIPTRIDNCGGVINGTSGDYTFPHTFTGKGTYPIVWEFDDGTNKYYETQNIIIEDNEAPVPDNLVLPDITEGCELGFIIPPTATDNCFASGNSFSATTTTPFPINTFGTTVVEWTFDDGNGNITTQYQNVILAATPVLGGELLGVMENIYDANGDPMAPTHNIPISECHDITNSITIELTGYTGDIIHWEKFEEGSNAWSIIPITAESQTIGFTYSASKSTLYRVLISSGTCYQYSTIFNIHSIPPDIPPVLDQYVFDDLCLNDEVNLVAYSGYLDYVDLEEEEGGNFNIGQFPNKWDPTQWKIDGQVAGTQWSAAGNNSAVNNWSGTNNHPVGTNYKIEYDSNDFMFGIAHGDYTSQQYIDDYGGNPTTLETPIFSLFGLASASIDFDQAYNLHAGDIAKVELSIDGGVTYTITLQDLVGTSPVANSWGPVPYPYQAPRPNNSTTTYFDFEDDNTSYDISDYIGFDNIRVRWTFYGTTDESTWAIDNINIPIAGADSNQIEWTEGIGEPGYYIIRGELTVAYEFIPEAPGHHQYGATTLINECRSYDSEGTALADVYVNYSYAGEDIIYTNDECGRNEVKLNAYDNSKSANENAAKGAFVAPADCSTCDDPGTMTQGEWTQVFSTSCGSGQFISDNPTLYPNPANDPDATFIGEAGLYTLTWTVNGCADTVLVDIKNCSVIDFDGVDDYIDLKSQNYDLDGEFSLEMWIKPTVISGNIQTLISKRNADNLVDGYDLRLVNNTISFHWNSGSLSSLHPISNDRWYHIAVTHSSNNYSLYIDGIEVNSISGGAPNSNSYKTMVGAMDIDKRISRDPINYFNGWLDELRIWNTALTVEQIHQMMNQEIKQDPSSNNVIGEIIPIDIHGLPWSSLIGYYRMDDTSCGYVNSAFGVGANGKLKNIHSSQEETAPLPYISNNNGDWNNINTWLRPTVWNTPNSIGVDGSTTIDWNIVEINNNINSGDKDITVLGLISNSGELTIMEPGIEDENNSGRMLWVTHYLKLDGSIDLVGESQLIQKPYWSDQYYESMLEESSIGFIERDQQGIMNSFAYNYWSSPVSKIGVGNNNGVYINEILRDGTTSTNPQSINFGSQFEYYHADGALSTPIKIAESWIWKFSNNINDYNKWEFIGSNSGLLNTTEGYSMKGVTGAGTLDLNQENQNYVFVGKPNNVPFGLAGTPLVHTTFNAPADQNSPNISLTGNPFPSALDADQFIMDNINSTDGTLYFWEHWSNNTHLVDYYQGGYAIRKINNGVPAVTHPDISTGGASRSTPGDYIPVGQGFFVVSSTTGGDVVFKNSQRVFERENENGGSSSVFMRGTSNSANVKKTEDEIMRIRLGCESPDGYHRQILAAFFEGATDDVDYLYDGKALDKLANDAFFIQNDEYFVIQAFGEFRKDREIPIAVIIDEKQNGGIQKFMIDELENIPANIKVYIKDKTTGITYNISNESEFSISLESGEYKDRFAMVFRSNQKKRTLSVDDVSRKEDRVTIFMNNSLKEINIQKITQLDFEQIILYNTLGQKINAWNKGLDQNEVKLSVSNLSSGIYIINVETSLGTISRKVNIN